MKTKRGLAILFVLCVVITVTPSVAYAAEVELVGQTSEFVLNPLLYISCVACVLLGAACTVSVLVMRAYKKQKATICKNYSCPHNPIVQSAEKKEAEEAAFGVSYDFKAIETPQELLRYRPSSDTSASVSELSVAKQPSFTPAQQALQAQLAQYNAGKKPSTLRHNAAATVGSTHRVSTESVHEMLERVIAEKQALAPNFARVEQKPRQRSEPLMQALPVMKHARSNFGQTASLRQIDVGQTMLSADQAIEHILKRHARKIS